jgi:hypothetical protein
MRPSDLSSRIGASLRKGSGMYYAWPAPPAKTDTPLEIAADEYEAIKAARHGLLRILDVEEKYDILLANYLELERDLLGIALRNTVSRDWSWEAFVEDLQLSNRRIANFLAAARMYLDHASHDLAILYGAESDVLTAFRDEASKQYDARLGYRAMEALRNFALHRALPIKIFGYPNDSIEVEGAQTRRLRFGATAYLSTASLEEEGGLKPTILAELKQLGAKIDVMPLVREYVAGLSEAHERLRTLTDADVMKWEGAMKAVQIKVGKLAPDFGEIAAVISSQPRFGAADEIHVMSQPLRRRYRLRRKNEHVGNLTDRFVTSSKD